MLIALVMAAMSVGDPDAPVATAPSRLIAPDALITASASVSPAQPQKPSAAHGLSTSEQIDLWIAARAGENLSTSPFTDDDAEPRRVYGEVSVGVGTGGYREYGGTVVMPLGEKGTLGVSYHRVENDRRLYPSGPIDPYATSGQHLTPNVARRGLSRGMDDRFPALNGSPGPQPFDDMR